MFVSDSHHPQVLDHTAYHSREQYERELECVFMPGWHFAATMSEFPEDGDYVTRNVLDHPLIFWRKDDEVHAFLNVCAHRSCTLTSACGGNFSQMKCQYHGWEYDKTGNTRKIPDAKSFRPLKPGVVGLRKYRTESVGQVTFFTFNDDAPPLSEFLGPAYDLCENLFDDSWQATGPSDRDIDCNWKCYLENTVETYHVESVHPETLRQMPTEESCIHEFGDGWSLLRTSGKEDRLDSMDRFAHRMLGVERDLDYWNMLIYPNIVLGKMGLFGWIDESMPVGPGKMQVHGRGFTRRGKSGVRASIMRRLVSRWSRKFFSKLVAEDVAVLNCVQQGLEAPSQPLGGLISTREERVFHFQEYIKRKTQDEDEAPSNGRPHAEQATSRAASASPVGQPS